jgi:hypothetical protein
MPRQCFSVQFVLPNSEHVYTNGVKGWLAYWKGKLAKGGEEIIEQIRIVQEFPLYSDPWLWCGYLVTI